MPELDWNEYDFIQVLVVLPIDEDGYGVHSTFDVSKGGVRLVVDVWPHESVVGLSLHAASVPEPLAEFVVFVRGTARRLETTDTEWIELGDCVVAPSRFSYLEMGNPLDLQRFRAGYPVRIYTTPQIRVEFRRN